MKGFDVIKGFAKELMEIFVLFIGLGVLAGVILEKQTSHSSQESPTTSSVC